MELVLILILAGLALALVGALLYTRSRRRQLLDPTRTEQLSADTRSRDLEVPDLDADADAQPSGGVLVEEHPATDVALDDGATIEAEPEVEPEPVRERATFRERLAKARGAVSGYFGSVLSRGKIDDETWEELEEALIGADVGLDTTMAMLDRVKERVNEDGIKDPQAMMDVLKEEMVAEASGHDISLAVSGDPAVWMFVGVNGVGKTTTIGKLAKREAEAGKSVVLAAGDTFRAAAAEQLETWAGRAGTGFIRGAEGADPGSVIFDAVEHAAAESADLVMADTAGRLHNKTNLMEELRKVRRVAEKGRGSVSEVLLVIDATTGQNGLVQARQFTDAVDVTGVVLTKLDGTAKGGIVLAIQSELGIPVKLVGLGEGIEDLVEFDANEFVEALFSG